MKLKFRNDEQILDCRVRWWWNLASKDAWNAVLGVAVAVVAVAEESLVSSSASNDFYLKSSIKSFVSQSI